MADELLRERRGHVELLTINRPEARNAMNRAAAGALASPAQPLGPRSDPELAHRGQRDALVQHLEAAVLDLAQQRAVDVGHHQPGLLGLPVGGRQQGQGLVVQGMGTLGLGGHQRGEAIAVAPGGVALEQLVRLDVEALQLADRQVDATSPRVVADVADDVGQLHGQSEPVGVVGGLRLGLAEDRGGDLADHPRHQVAVTLQRRVVEEAGLLQVGLAALDHGVQVRRPDAETGRVRHQGEHGRVGGLEIGRAHV